jgi:hypothetical protein
MSLIQLIVLAAIGGAAIAGFRVLKNLVRRKRGAALARATERYRETNPSLTDAAAWGRRIGAARLCDQEEAGRELRRTKFPNGYSYIELVGSMGDEIKAWEDENWTCISFESYQRMPAICARCGRDLLAPVPTRRLEQVTDYWGGTIRTSIEVPMCRGEECIVDPEREFFRLTPRMLKPSVNDLRHTIEGNQAPNAPGPGAVTLERVHRRFAAAVKA